MRLCEQSGDVDQATRDPSLPEDFREIIVLREYEELSYQENRHFVVTARLGTVRVRLEARSKLLSLLS